MKMCSQVELIVMRGLLCKLDCPDFQSIGQFGTDEEVIVMSNRVMMSAHTIFDVTPPIDREVNC